MQPRARSDTYYLELFLAAVLLLFSLWIIAPWFDAFSSSAFDVMKQVGRTPQEAELIWGAFGTLAGGLKLLGIRFNWRRVRMAALIMSVFFWTCISLTIIAANPAVTAVPVYSLFALSNFYLLVSRLK